MTNSRILVFAVMMFLLLNITILIYTQIRISEFSQTPMADTAFASGVAELCINDPPYNLIVNCNLTIPWGYAYTCSNITANDNYPLTIFSYSSLFLTNNTLFSISNSGLINFSAPKSAIGNHVVRITVYDDSKCSNNMYSQDYNISIFDANHPPYLATMIPNASISNGTSVSYYLNDYFKDPDNDNLTYDYIQLASGLASVSLDNNSLVTIKASSCGDFKVFFIATDPYSLTATSNVVKYTISGCPLPQGSQNSGSGSGSGSDNYLCTSDWRCARWSNCNIGNKTTLECRDYNACDPNHYLEVLEKNCTYVPEIYQCEENWNCTDWNPCIKSIQSRSCLDQNSCGTNFTKPLELQNCSLITSCFNGIKDGNETGIDCGGVCAPCKNIEAPTTINSINTNVLIASGLTFGMIALFLYAFRKHLQKYFASFKKKTKTKQILIKDAQKERLLQQTYIIQTRLEEKKYSSVQSGIALFLRDYFKELLGVEHLTKDTLLKGLGNLKDKELAKQMFEFYSRLAPLEMHKADADYMELQELLDMMLQHIYLVSEFTEKDAIICIKERSFETDDGLERGYIKLSNIYIALQFSELGPAKKLYEELLKDYDALLVMEKRSIFNDIMLAYGMIRYLEDQEK